MKYVLDSSVGSKTLIAETDSAKARQLADDYRQRIHELLAADVFPVEIAHAITRAERQGQTGQSPALEDHYDVKVHSERGKILDKN